MTSSLPPALVKDLSKGTHAGEPSDLEPYKGSASSMAATHRDREMFSSMFAITDETNAIGSELTTTSGEPLSAIVRYHWPSNGWLSEKQKELVSTVGNLQNYDPFENDIKNLPMLRSVEAGMIGDISAYFATNPTDDADEGADAALTKHFESLKTLCVKINLLRLQIPPPPKSNWVGLLDQILTHAAERFDSALISSKRQEGEPKAQAMPRPFKRPGETPYHDPIGLPASFTPDRVMQISRAIATSATPLSRRQIRCLQAARTVDKRGIKYASFPVIAAEYKAHTDDAPQGRGQALYSAVQAAAIFQNANAGEQIITLSICQGIVEPQVSCWPGKLETVPGKEDYLAAVKKFDVCIVQGIELDLSKLADVIALFLMVYRHARKHMHAAFDIASLGLALKGKELDRRLQIARPTPVPIHPNPLVEWRARTVPSALLEGRKRKRAQTQSRDKVKKKRKTGTYNSPADEANEGPEDGTEEESDEEQD
ncbi:hypothetical protein MVEN_00312000 [Mycena venus]|uniref:Uncharacterized protein n=1 Tax=Mycena venus TaxID=2733690 RepID=A0A8H6YZA1_9AGAR|nr:hypothetical protein MVEN_00312000 [Mycena venus]